MNAPPERVAQWRSAYAKAEPFPHIVIDDFVPKELCQQLFREFDAVEWHCYRHFNEDKQGINVRSITPALTRALERLNSPPFLRLLEEITGIGDLIPDRELGAGGIHQSTRGGFLNIHADFTVHPYHREWHRRINVLIYLNDTWSKEWGGELELWATDMSRCVQKITPKAGRCVIFNTSKDSFHGHPDPMQCPPDVWRRSIAMYYYTQDHVEAIATEYRPRPVDGPIKRSLIFADKLALRIFHKAKGLLGVRDDLATRIMARWRG